MMKIRPKKLPTLLLMTASPVIRAFFETRIHTLDDYALICAHSDIETFSYLHKTYISFIVIDAKTPHIDLIPLCEKIRTLQEHSDTPILIITNHLKKTLTRNLLKAGATDFLREPLDEDEFFCRMEMAKEKMETKQKITTLSQRLGSGAKGGTCMQKRAVIDDRARKAIEVALLEKHAFSILLMEIDHYQELQKTHGEHEIHTLLMDFEDRLQKFMRIQDLLFNQKHGKFVIFLPKTSGKGSQFIAENIQEALQTETFSAGNIQLPLTLSIGLATLGTSGDGTKSAAINLERILAAATTCLNQAKKTGNTIISHLQMRENL